MMRTITISMNCLLAGLSIGDGVLCVKDILVIAMCCVTVSDNTWLGRLYHLINDDGTNKYHQNKTNNKHSVGYSFHTIHPADTTGTK
jgi:hypothetical protein